MTERELTGSPQPDSPLRGIVRRFFANPLGVIGLTVVVLFIAVGVFAPHLAEYPEGYGAVDKILNPPSASQPFGTDDMGLDIFGQVVWGARISLLVSLSAMLLAAVIGIPMGLLGGFFKGRIDAVVMGLIDVFLSIPVLPLIILAIAILGPGIQNIALILGLISWPTIAKISRGQALSISEEPYVEAGKAIGAKSPYLIGRYVLPNSLPPIMVNMALVAARAVLSEAGLSFLGLGDPLHWSWGQIIHQAYKNGSFIKAWWTTLFPSLAIFLFVISLNFIGLALNEATNPRLQR